MNYESFTHLIDAIDEFICPANSNSAHFPLSFRETQGHPLVHYNLQDICICLQSNKSALCVVFIVLVSADNLCFVRAQSP